MNRLAISLTIIFLLAVSAFAQINTSTITGTVEDPSKAVVANAQVTAKNDDSGVEYKTTTTGAGTFAIPSVSPGTYTITVTAPGFKTVSSKGNVLKTGLPLDVTLMLAVGASEDTVEVIESAARVETTSSAFGDVVERRQIRDLPLNGRNPLNLITLQPGLIQRSSGNNGSGTHINGSRDRAFNVTLDGIDINEPSVPNPQSNVFRLNTDNVQEFRIVTSGASADIGRNSGANIALASRPGTNDIHGVFFEYHRNPKTQSNDYFNNLQGLPKAASRLNQFGVEAGGPIVKNKTFWFGSWQMQRLSFTQSIAKALGSTPIVYTPTARSGIFRYYMITNPTNPAQIISANSPTLVDSSGNLQPGIPACATATSVNCIRTYDVRSNDAAAGGTGVLDTAMTAYFNAMPAPNNFATGDGLNTAGFSWNPTSTVPEQRFSFRLDHNFDQNNSIFGRYTWAYSDTKQGDFLNGRPQVFPGYPPTGEVIRRPKNAAINYRRVLSPQMVNEFTVGFSRFIFDFPQGSVNPSFPNIVPFVSNNIAEPFINASGTARALTTAQFIDNLSYQRGAHTWKTGINFRFIRHNDNRALVGTVQNAPTMSFSGGARTPFGTSSDFGTTGTGYRIPTQLSTADRDRLRNMINDLLGRPSSLTQAYFSDGLGGYNPSGIYLRGIRFHQYNAFIQDDWKIRRNLTLNLGLRWEYNPPGTEASGRILRPDKAIDGSQGLVSFAPAERFWDRENRNAFAPRIGFAWDPWSDGKNSIRGNYGINYDPISTFQMVPILGTIPGSSAQCLLSLTDNSTTGATTAAITSNCTTPASSTARVAAGFPGSLAPPTVGPAFFVSPAQQSRSTAPLAAAVDPDLKNPTVQTWGLSFQHDLGANTILDIGYLGKHGTHLHRAYNLNQGNLNHDDFVGSVIRARDNLINCGNAYGTAGCGQAVGILATIFPQTAVTGQGNLNVTANELNSTTTAGLLRANSAGGIANRMDSTFYARMAAITVNPNFIRPNSQFSSIFFMDANGGSNYHALQVHVRKRGKNFNLGAGYTWSKSIDDLSIDPVGASSGGGLSTTSTRSPSDVRNFNIDRGRSDFDRRHVITANWLWDLPFGKGQRWAQDGWKNQLFGGWTLTDILIFQSGEAFSVLSGNFTASDIKQSRANIVGSAPVTGLYTVPGILGYSAFDQATTLTAAGFAIPQPGSYGNQGRNMFTGPNFWNTDFGVGKRFDLTERWKLQLRAEFFNVLNHPNFDTPEGSSDGNRQAFATNSTTRNNNFARLCCVQVSTPGSSAIVSTGEGSRVIQFAGRLIF
ncbi:MAG TPA: TonB-dependent receptor [Terriglobales bacterium]|nr:TonB-dependent receptor [Terriglobales bacterium]